MRHGFDVHRCALWQVNAISVRVGGVAVLVDSPVLPAELAALPRPDLLVITHAHFDHVLARTAFDDLPVHAGDGTRTALASGAWRDELRESDEELYVERPVLPRLDDVAPLPDLGWETADAPGHAADGTAFLVEEHALLLPGDYLVEVEIPLVSKAGSVAGYLATLDRLEPLVRCAQTVVPGHGPPIGRDRALELLDLDRRYVADLRGGPRRGPRSHRQKRIHEDDVAKHG